MRTEFNLKEKVIALKGVQARSIQRLRTILSEEKDQKQKKRIHDVMTDLEASLGNPTDQQLQHILFNLKLITDNND